MNFIHISLMIAVIAYASSSACYLHAFPDIKNRDIFRKVGWGLFQVATLLMSITLILVPEYGFYNKTSGLILITSMSWVNIFCNYFLNLRMMATFVAPLSTFILLFLFFSVQGEGHYQSEPPTMIAGIHIATAILGQTFSICACAISALYLFQQRALKRKNFSFLTNATPTMEKLDAFLASTLWIGFAFITLALITGAIYTLFFAPHFLKTHEWKIIWSLAVWSWYLITLLGRNIFSLSTKKIAKMSLVGFVIMSISAFGLISWRANL